VREREKERERERECLVGGASLGRRKVWMHYQLRVQVTTMQRQRTKKEKRTKHKERKKNKEQRKTKETPTVSLSFSPFLSLNDTHGDGWDVLIQCPNAMS